MPVSYTKIPYDQILKNQIAYDMIDLAGRSYFEKWDMLEFEKAILGMGENKYIKNEKDHNAVMGILTELDKTMPFLKFKEEGQHYAYELFLSDPDGWCSRGAPFFWAYVARQFTFDRLPMPPEQFSEKYMTIVAALGIPYGADESVYLKRFAAGGMSSGIVNGVFVKEAHETLLKRLVKYK